MASRPEIQYIQFYVDGSAARKLDPIEPEKTSTGQTISRPKTQKRRKIYIDPVAILGIVVSAMMLVSMLCGVVRLKQAQDQTDAMELRVAQLRLDNRQLQAQHNEEIDLRDIERKALALGMVPAEMITVNTIALEKPEQTQEPVSLWQQVATFLTSLFA